MSTLSAPVHLFVYGTLRRCAEPSMHPLLKPAAFVGAGVLAGRLYDLGQYPGAVVEAAADTVIQGEVYALQEPLDTLDRLDRYEGCAEDDPAPHEYARSWQQVLLRTGELVSAWVYLYALPTGHLRQIDTGDWLRR